MTQASLGNKELRMAEAQSSEPSVTKWALKVAASVGLAGILCCVAPMVLFMLGLMGGIYAISFADAFYSADGSAAFGAWMLRGVAAIVGVAGIWYYRRKQNQCSIDPKRKRKNLIILTATIALLGVGFYFSLEKLSGWYFDNYIVPAQQQEFQEQSE
jgi:hypothetical protein